MLETSFRRPVGDIGNPGTFPFPVIYAGVPGASIQRVVKEGDRQLIAGFINHGRSLEKRGATAIATSCGFLAMFQTEIQAGLSVPFSSSSLLQIADAEATHGPVGVITAREASLSRAHFLGAGCKQMPTAVAGLDSSPAFTSAIIEQIRPLDEAAVRLEVEVVTNSLIQSNPALKAIVLECTNLPPYADTVRRISGLPVYDSTSLCIQLMLSVHR